MYLKIKNALLNRNNLILIFFTLLFLNYLFFNYRILFRGNGYILGDWLLNYSGGFVRRGFLGHIFYLISNFFNISIIHIIFLFSSSIYLMSLYFFYQIIKNKLNNNLILIFIFLPSTFLFNFFDPLTVGRKEILVFFFFSFYFLYLDKIKLNLNFKIFTFFLSIIFILTHEIIFFLIPFLFVLKYFHIQKLNLKSYYLEIVIFLFGLMIMVMIMIFSHQHNNSLLCSSLKNVGLSTDLCYGIINEFGSSSTKSKNLLSTVPLGYFLERNYFKNYLIYFFLSTIPLALMILRSKASFNNKVIFTLLSFFCLLSSVIFFAKVNDWGRYLNIFFLLQFLITLKFIESNPIENDIKFRVFKALKIFILLLYLTAWHMPHCCNPNLGMGYHNVYDRIVSRLYDESTNSTKYKDLPRTFLRKLLKIE
jgi:hypothetical protein